MRLVGTYQRIYDYCCRAGHHCLCLLVYATSPAFSSLSLSIDQLSGAFLCTAYRGMNLLAVLTVMKEYSGQWNYFVWSGGYAINRGLLYSDQFHVLWPIPRTLTNSTYSDWYLFVLHMCNVTVTMKLRIWNHICCPSWFGLSLLRMYVNTFQLCMLCLWYMVLSHLMTELFNSLEILQNYGNLHIQSFQ